MTFLKGEKTGGILTDTMENLTFVEIPLVMRRTVGVLSPYGSTGLQCFAAVENAGENQQTGAAEKEASAVRIRETVEEMGGSDCRK